MVPLLLAFSAFYLVIIFPFSYFRHDDWLILGNSALILPHDWSFLWRPTLFYGNQEVAWFFRPFFKLFVYVFYEAFGFHYYLWLTGLLAFALGALYAGFRTLEKLTKSPARALLFLGVFVASLHFHLGSLAWMGEGMMNTPQLALLSLCTYFFVRNPKSFAALATFVLALGFKESSVFHSFFLALLFLGEAHFARARQTSTVRVLAPYAIISALYLGLRLIGMPWNPSYSPVWEAGTILKPALMLFTVPAAALTAYFFARRSLKGVEKAVAKKWFYFLFFIPCVGPYFGHNFFSPGWLLLPAFYFSFVLAVVVPELPVGFLRRATAAALLISAVPVTAYLVQIGWWQWKAKQVQMREIVRDAPESLRRLTIVDCPSEHHPAARFERVVGFEAGLYFLWAMHHASRIPVQIAECQGAASRRVSTADELVLRWKFPEFGPIR